MRDVAILGSSKQARRQLQAIVRTVPGIKQVRVYSPTQENREKFARECSEWLGVYVNAVDSAEEAVRGAEIVDVATNTKTPAFEWGWLKQGALVMAIGGGQVPDEVLSEARVVLPTWDSTEDPETGREPYGSAIRAGKYTKDDVAAELGAVILGEKKVREDDDTTVVFDVGRINIWAVATTFWAYEWCRSASSVRRSACRRADRYSNRRASGRATFQTIIRMKPMLTLPMTASEGLVSCAARPSVSIENGSAPMPMLSSPSARPASRRQPRHNEGTLHRAEPRAGDAGDNQRRQRQRVPRRAGENEKERTSPPSSRRRRPCRAQTAGRAR